MAEALGLAASVAGLLSLGLQVTGGIASYLDALENRQMELASVKQQKDALKSSLAIVQAAASRVQNHHAHTITASIQSCEAELQAIETLLADLANCDTSRSTERLATIESSSHGHGSELLVLRSEVAAAITPLADLRNRVVTTDQLQESSRVMRGMFERSHESLQLTLGMQSERIIRLEKLLENLQPTDISNQSMGALARRVASKPAALKELCDNTSALEHEHYEQSLSSPSTHHIPDSTFPPIHEQRVTSLMRPICNCRRSYRLASHRRMSLGHVHLSEEKAIQGHWPACPLSSIQSTRKQRRTVGFKYTGLTQLLRSIIGVSFTVTSGAGGSSIGANLTCYPTVDRNSDPSFLIVENVFEILAVRTGEETNALFVVACIKKLRRLFVEKKACPTAVSNFNQSLLHDAFDSVWMLTSYANSRVPLALTQLIGTLLQYGVPAITYDNHGESPLAQLDLYERPSKEIEDIIQLLVSENSEGSSVATQPLELSETRVGPWTSHTVLLYNASCGFAEACECGPLSMAVIRNDISEVDHILDRLPGSLLETDIHGQSPIHLAASKAGILALLVQAADVDTLDRVDVAGISAIEVAMMRSGDKCIHSTSSKRCRGCGCTECVDILLKAGCVLRTYAGNSYITGLRVSEILESASELAKRRYIFELHERMVCETDTSGVTYSAYNDSGSENSIGDSTSSSDVDSIRGNNKNVEHWGWVYEEIYDTHVADLFYRYGFRPGSSFVFDYQRKMENSSYFHSNASFVGYIHWLVAHGANLYARSSTVPPIREQDPDIGLFSAHFAFFTAGSCVSRLMPGPDGAEFENLVTFNKCNTDVMRHNLTDGCQCHCSTRGCSPFLWMLKGLISSWISIDTTEWYMEVYYSNCGTELTMLTYEAAIRYATFKALGLAHTCCDPEPIVECAPCGHPKRPRWLEADEVTNINDEQALLLELLEALIVEFTEKAGEYLERRRFQDFWTETWIRRINEELVRLDGCNLSNAERRGAEEIGVRWCEPPSVKETKDRNPYERKTLKWFFYELDSICPEYREPWPEELHQITW
ncbi:hypothetical protein PG991_011900 [Apiospora marii]|uniref:Fungal N-terminal domain-containing protein n=1 Tax=Apiospora marii TaxID=335849 RepID=A0ABR1RGI1_9PEZI